MKTWFAELYYQQVTVAVKRRLSNFYYILRVYSRVYSRVALNFFFIRKQLSVFLTY
jgi:hypothetical protein